jgi:hypothetical protein
MLRNGLNVTLAGDVNSLLFEAGAPDAGTGIDGDVSIDWAGNAYYTKAAGAWSSTGSIYSAGGGIPIPADNDGLSVYIEATETMDLWSGLATSIRTGNASTGNSKAITIRTGNVDATTGNYAEPVYIQGGDKGAGTGSRIMVGGAGAGGSALQLYAGYESGQTGIVDVVAGILSLVANTRVDITGPVVFTSPTIKDSAADRGFSVSTVNNASGSAGHFQFDGGQGSAIGGGFFVYGGTGNGGATGGATLEIGGGGTVGDGGAVLKGGSVNGNVYIQTGLTSGTLQLAGTTKVNVVGPLVVELPSSTTPVTLTNNRDLTFTRTSDTNLRLSMRGNDGVTRVANITLA